MTEGFRLTTNNRMELLAVIKGLEALKGEGFEVTVVSDSKYVVDSVEKGWLHNWVRKNWKDVKNVDLWQRFLPLSKKHKVRFRWIKGHAGHPENERCDRLAVMSAAGGNLLIDEGYEASKI